MIELNLNQVVLDQCVGYQQLNRVFQSLSFTYAFDKKDLVELQEKTKYYTCEEEQVIQQKGDAQDSIVIVFKGRLGNQQTKGKKVERIYEIGSIIGLEQFAYQTSSSKTIIALEESVIGKITISEQLDPDFGQRITSNTFKCVGLLKKFSFLNLMSDQNLLRLISSSKLQHLQHQEQIRCPSESYMLVLQGRFQDQDQSSTNIKSNSITAVSQLQTRQGVKMEYTQGEIISQQSQIGGFKISRIPSEIKDDQENTQTFPLANQISNNTLFCKTEEGAVILLIQKSDYLKYTQFYQGVLQTKRLSKQKGQYTNNQDSSQNSYDLSSSNIKSNILNQQKKFQILTKYNEHSLLNNYQQNKKNTEQSVSQIAKVQSFQVPKVDLDLFTKRSNVSPDQKKEFYECYSGRNHEGTVKQSILRNYSELTSRKNKNQVSLTPIIANNVFSSQTNLNVQQGYSVNHSSGDNTMRNQKLQKHSSQFANKQDIEFEQILKFNQMLQSKSSFKDSKLNQQQSYQQQSNQSLIQQQDKYMNTSKSQANYIKIYQNESEKTAQFSNIYTESSPLEKNSLLRFSQSSFGEHLLIKAPYLEQDSKLNSTPKKLGSQPQLHYPLLIQNQSQPNLTNQQQQQHSQQPQHQHQLQSQQHMNNQQQRQANKFMISLEDYQQSIPNQLNQLKQSSDFNENNPTTTTSSKKRGFYHQFTKSYDFTSRESLSTRQSMDKTKNASNFYNIASHQQPVQSLSQQTPSLFQNDYQINNSRKRQNSEIANTQIEPVFTHHENSLKQSRQSSKSKTQNDAEKMNSGHSIQQSYLYDTQQNSVLEDINNKTATFNKIQLNSTIERNHKNALSEKIQKSLNFSNKSINMFLKKNGSRLSTNINKSSQLQTEENQILNQLKEQNLQLFTFYNKPLFSSKS